MINRSAFQNITAQAKLAAVNNKLGNPGLKKNQGSSVEVWDYIKVTPGAAGVIRFFENVNAKTFPFTNIQQNQLQVGEALAVEYIAFTRLTKAPLIGDKISSWTSLLAAAPTVTLSSMSFLLDNSRIIKNNSLTRSSKFLNTKGQTAENNLFYPDTDLTIPPQISFTVELNIPANADTVDEREECYYGVHLFGTGAILNLKTNV